MVTDTLNDLSHSFTWRRVLGWPSGADRQVSATRDMCGNFESVNLDIGKLDIGKLHNERPEL